MTDLTGGGVTKVYLQGGDSAVLCVIVDNGTMRQVNAMTARSQSIGVWALFPADTPDEDAARALAPVVFGRPYTDGEVVTDEVQGAIAASIVEFEVPEASRIH